MIYIFLLTAFSFYMFWRYNQQRKLKNAEHSREKRELFMNLISILQNKEEPEQKNTKNAQHES
jgi:hypothetical protein